MKSEEFYWGYLYSKVNWLCEKSAKKEEKQSGIVHATLFTSRAPRIWFNWFRHDALIHTWSYLNQKNAVHWSICKSTMNADSLAQDAVAAAMKQSPSHF